MQPEFLLFVSEIIGKTLRIEPHLVVPLLTVWSQEPHSPIIDELLDSPVFYMLAPALILIVVSNWLSRLRAVAKESGNLSDATSKTPED